MQRFLLYFYDAFDFYDPIKKQPYKKQYLTSLFAQNNTKYSKIVGILYFENNKFLKESIIDMRDENVKDLCL